MPVRSKSTLFQASIYNMNHLHQTTYQLFPIIFFHPTFSNSKFVSSFLFLKEGSRMLHLQDIQISNTVLSSSVILKKSYHSSQMLLSSLNFDCQVYWYLKISKPETYLSFQMFQYKFCWDSNIFSFDISNLMGQHLRI